MDLCISGWGAGVGSCGVGSCGVGADGGPGAGRNGEQRSARELGGGGKSVEAGRRNGVEGGG